MQFYIDYAYTDDHEMTLIGWAAPEDSRGTLSYEVRGADGKMRETLFLSSSRPDIGYSLFRDPDRKDLGYFLRFPYEKGETVTLRIVETQGGKETASSERAVSDQSIRTKNRLRLWKQRLSVPIAFAKKVKRKLFHAETLEYRAWFLRHRANDETLENERKTVFEYAPKISVVVPLYRTDPAFFREMADSVLHQSYQNFELILVNTSRDCEALSEAVASYAASDRRIKAITLKENGGISENTNAGIREAEGDFTAFLDHDDKLEPDALHAFVSYLNAHPKTDVLYSDEDKFTSGDDTYCYPNFKPDWSPDFLNANNYICHFLMVRTALLKETGGFLKEFDGAQDHDLLFRLTEKTDAVGHVPRVLYHWRMGSGSTAMKFSRKTYAMDAGLLAIRRHYERIGVNASVEPGRIGGWYVTRHTLSEEPQVSVIIPNKDHVKDLKACLDSLYQTSVYRNIEVLVIENNSVEAETEAFYEQAEKTYPNLRVIRYEGGFNYSAINNLGASEAKGEYLLLLNNDVTAESPDFLKSMVSYAMRPDVGAVGARLLYPDRTVQHAGVLIGFGGMAGHLFKGLREHEPGYMCRSITTTDVSAVTAACLVVKKSVYDEVGGLDEAFQVAFNDIDFCLKIRSKGYRIVYDAEAVLIHAESKSRGVENTPEKFQRFSRETDLLSRKWKIMFRTDDATVDPYYNPNCSYLEYFKPGD